MPLRACLSFCSASDLRRSAAIGPGDIDRTIEDASPSRVTGLTHFRGTGSLPLPDTDRKCVRLGPALRRDARARHFDTHKEADGRHGPVRERQRLLMSAPTYAPCLDTGRYGYFTTKVPSWHARCRLPKWRGSSPPSSPPWNHPTEGPRVVRCRVGISMYALIETAKVAQVEVAVFASSGAGADLTCTKHIRPKRGKHDQFRSYQETKRLVGSSLCTTHMISRILSATEQRRPPLPTVLEALKTLGLARSPRLLTEVGD